MAQPHVVPAAHDAALIAAWQAGDERAAAELVERHARALARFLSGVGAPDADVDDLVQETFIRAFRGVSGFRGQCQFRTWLLTIGGNVLKDFGRRASRRQVVPLDDAVQDSRGDPHEPASVARCHRTFVPDGLLQPPQVALGDGAAVEVQAGPGLGGGLVLPEGQGTRK